MKNETIHEETRNGLRIRIEIDPEPMNPREWDNLGIMYCEHSKYGHPSRAHWNVALWFGNDYGLYRLALACKTGKELLARCKATGFVKTPDGYTLTERLCQHAWECVNE